MNPRKLLLPLLLALLSIILLGCPQKAEEDQTKEESSPSVEDIVQTEEPVNPGDIVIEKAPVNTDTANSRDPYWSTLGYETWQGITDVTELPESLMLDMLNVNRMLWQSESYLTLEEIISKYNLDLGELDAENLNSAGYDLYVKGDYESAMQMFIEAMNIDPTYVYAHYNFACAGSLYLQYWANQDSGLYAQQEGYYNEEFLTTVQDEVFQNLSISYFLASRYLEKSKTDSDLEYIRSLKLYSNLRQNLSETKFWGLYGYHQSEVSDIEEFPESGQLSITLDGGFYSGYSYSDLWDDHKGRINQWEFDTHKLISNDQVSLTKLENNDIKRLGYRVDYDTGNSKDIGRQPYIITYEDMFSIEGLLYRDEIWKIEGTKTLYRYNIDYPKKTSIGTLRFTSYHDFNVSNKSNYYDSIRDSYELHRKLFKSYIDEKLKN
ncbi:tetratricopeptide repeat protein [Spirochaeta cellobiosiphila]|uniref:tetratricopeptide repeat protein n=1 Tax=Spirochaeta cellobiosiphila TaxID=504483 RepID=UPI0003FDC39F|nr:hypothetical protein [Spirochaeta cellobiosiphila]